MPSSKKASMPPAKRATASRASKATTKKPPAPRRKEVNATKGSAKKATAPRAKKVSATKAAAPRSKKAAAPGPKKAAAPGPKKAATPSQLIDGRITELGDWRGATLRRLRELIKEVDPDVVEEWKWRGVPTWYHDGMLFTGETYKSVVKMTFAKGAALEDPSGLFNSSLEGSTRRAIDLHEGEALNERALKALFRAAIALNASTS